MAFSPESWIPADFGTEIMVYGPRDESEIEIVLGFIGESIAYAREHGLKA